MQAQSNALLEANDEAYGVLVGRILELDIRRQPDEVATAIGRAAFLASHFHTGRFADGRLEYIARSIGVGINDDVSAPPDANTVLPRAEPRRVLHVTTSAWAIGGHTRTIEHWVRGDNGSLHTLALLDQGSREIPEWLVLVMASSGGIVSCEAHWTPVRKAAWLRELAYQSADLVVLHTFPFDVVPVMAFAVEGGPPVALLNHADHAFWLGSSIADTVINLRSAGASHSAERRFVSHNLVLPIPLALPEAAPSRAEARRALGIPEDSVALLSVARSEKFRPSGSYDFVATAARILERNASAHIYVVGESVAGIAPFLRCPIHERLHFVGTVPDPSQYHAAVDVYIESFPFGSQTALLEAALAGLPAVPAYAPLFPLVVTNDDSLLELLPNPVDEADYVERAERLIDDPDRRRALGANLRNRLLGDHVGLGWTRRLSALYRHTDTMRHAPRSIPATSCETTPADLSLSTFRILAEREFRAAPDALAHRYAVAIHAGQVARMFDEYGAARRHAWRAVQLAPASSRSWRLLALALLGPQPKRLKALLRR